MARFYFGKSCCKLDHIKYCCNQDKIEQNICILWVKKAWVVPIVEKKLIHKFKKKLKLFCFFLIIVLISSLKFKIVSKIIPRCFWWGTSATGFWLKNYGGNFFFFFYSYEKKINSWASLAGSVLKFMFHCKGHSIIFSKGLIFSLRPFLAVESRSKMITHAFYFMLKAIFVPEIFKFFPLKFWAGRKTTCPEI